MKREIPELTYEPTYEDTDIYWTSFDIDVVSSAVAILGYKIQHINRDQHPTKALFVLAKTDELLDIADKFYADELFVNPRLLLDTRQALLNRLRASE